MARQAESIGPPIGGIPALDNIRAVATTLLGLLDDAIERDKIPAGLASQEALRARQLARRALDEAVSCSLLAISHHQNHTARPLSVIQSFDALPIPKRT